MALNKETFNSLYEAVQYGKRRRVPLFMVGFNWLLGRSYNVFSASQDKKIINCMNNSVDVEACFAPTPLGKEYFGGINERIKNLLTHNKPDIVILKERNVWKYMAPYILLKLKNASHHEFASNITCSSHNCGVSYIKHAQGKSKIPLCAFDKCFLPQEKVNLTSINNSLYFIK